MPYSILDPRPLRANAPYTFYLPSDPALAHVAPNDLVKLMFASANPEAQYEAERMWVIVRERQGDTFTGTLDNVPQDIEGLSLGDTVAFCTHNIIDVDPQDPENAPDSPDLTERWLARCLVDRAVIDGRARVGFLFRESPDTPENATYPDSGWCLRAHEDEISKEEFDAEDILYVALGAVLNKDDSFVALLDSPPRSAFELQADGTFVSVPFEEPEDEEDG